jgi:hypothetical protein
MDCIFDSVAGTENQVGLQEKCGHYGKTTKKTEINKHRIMQHVAPPSASFRPSVHILRLTAQPSPEGHEDSETCNQHHVPSFREISMTRSLQLVSDWGPRPDSKADLIGGSFPGLLAERQTPKNLFVPHRIS